MSDNHALEGHIAWRITGRLKERDSDEIITCGEELGLAGDDATHFVHQHIINRSVTLENKFYKTLYFMDNYSISTLTG